MVKGIFLDFCGTVVHEDGSIIKIICERIMKTGNVSDTSQIGRYWWNEFQNLFTNSNGESFRCQRELEYQSIINTLEHFKSSESADALCNMMFERWVKPPLYEESKVFFEKCPVPVYIVSNIDNGDIRKIIEYHKLMPDRVFTSEDARSYKPRKEIFELALRETGLSREEVVHIGDSLSSDVQGANAFGISAIWLNRYGREVSDEVLAVSDLLQVLETDYFK